MNIHCTASTKNSRKFIHDDFLLGHTVYFLIWFHLYIIFYATVFNSVNDFAACRAFHR